MSKQGITSGKVWGQTHKVFDQNNVEMDHIIGKRGFACSLHHHDHKYNTFYAISGIWVIEVHKTYQQGSPIMIDRTVLLAGQTCRVKHGEKHRFVCLRSGHCIEIYHTEIEHDDIVRDSVGHALTEDEMSELEETLLDATSVQPPTIRQAGCMEVCGIPMASTLAEEQIDAQAETAIHKAAGHIDPPYDEAALTSKAEIDTLAGCTALQKMVEHGIVNLHDFTPDDLIPAFKMAAERLLAVVYQGDNRLNVGKVCEIVLDVLKETKAQFRNVEIRSKADLEKAWKADTTLIKSAIIIAVRETIKNNTSESRAERAVQAAQSDEDPLNTDEVDKATEITTKERFTAGIDQNLSGPSDPEKRRSLYYSIARALVIAYRDKSMMLANEVEQIIQTGIDIFAQDLGIGLTGKRHSVDALAEISTVLGFNDG